MEPERWRQAEDLFERGLDADTSERERLLGATEPDVAAMVRDLWRRQADVGSFLEHPVATPPDHPRQFSDGHTLAGRFKITGFLGAGGMGEVYSAQDDRLGRTVAIKVLHAHLTTDSDLRNRFEREARAVCSLNHPRICSLYDVGWEGVMPFLVMEHLSGQTLADRLACGRLPLDELLSVGEGIADALAYAHQHGVVHRDLKPGNIMLTEHGPKLLDFGIAKRVIAKGLPADKVTQTSSGAIVGSPAYMSPEQAEGRPTDHRSDEFSFGAVLYEMATGRRAFQGDTHMSTLAAVLEREPEPLRTLVPASPPALDRIVRRCLRKNRDDRYPDMVGVWADLQSVSKPSNRWRWVATAVATAAIATLASVWIWRPAPGKTEAPLPRAVQLTTDQGSSGDPSLSPDGKWLAYASDRGDARKMGIWIQRLDGSESRKLVECRVAGDPVFTPDGQRIVYVCGDNLLQTDLYLMGTDGGPSTLLAKGGEYPSISPNGKYVAYLDQRTRRRAVKSISGGEVVTLPSHRTVNRAVWSPDGEELLEFSDPDLKSWIVPRTGGAARETPLREALNKAGLEWTGITPLLVYAWTRTHVYLSFRAAGSSEVWRVPFDAKKGVPIGPSTRVTAASNVFSGHIQQGKVVFDVLMQDANLFAFQLGKDGRHVVGGPRQLTFESAVATNPSLSSDGRRLSYLSTPAGNSKLHVLDLASGRGSFVAELPGSSATTLEARISPDGKLVAWAENNSRDLYISPTDRPAKRRICMNCGLPMVWLPDGSALLLRKPGRENFGTVFLVELATGQRRVIMQAKDYFVAVSAVSRDGAWMVLEAEKDPGGGDATQLYVAPLDLSLKGTAIKEGVSDWIPIGSRGPFFSADWSARGDLVYVVDLTKNSIAAIPLNERTKYQIGPPIPLFELRAGPMQSLGYMSASSGLIVATIGTFRRNIWIQDLPK